jgi:hypothetical protein
MTEFFREFRDPPKDPDLKAAKDALEPYVEGEPVGRTVQRITWVLIALVFGAGIALAVGLWGGKLFLGLLK